MLALGETSNTLEAVRKLHTEIAAAADQGEENRHLSPQVVEKLRQAGIFRMLVPKRYGGDALNVSQACAVIEQLASSEGAAAWTAMVGFGFNVALARFPRATVDAIYAKGPDVGLRGAFAPIGAAIQVDSTPVYSKRSLQRRWRDVRVAAQHFGGSTVQYPTYGAQLAGIEPTAAARK